jgi:hypothetical protein
MEFVFAVPIGLYALAPISFWKGAIVVRVFVLLQAVGAVYIARGLTNARAWAWNAAFGLGVLGLIELWYASAIFVFSYMGEGLPYHGGYLFMMGCFGIQAIVSLLYVIERLALWRRAIRSYDSNDSAR